MNTPDDNTVIAQAMGGLDVIEEIMDPAEARVLAAATMGVSGALGAQAHWSAGVGGVDAYAQQQRNPHKQELRLVQELLKLNPRYTASIMLLIEEHANAKGITNPLSFLDPQNGFHSNEAGRKIKNFSMGKMLRSVQRGSQHNRFSDLKLKLDKGLVWPEKF